MLLPIVCVYAVTNFIEICAETVREVIKPRLDSGMQWNLESLRTLASSIVSIKSHNVDVVLRTLASMF